MEIYWKSRWNSVEIPMKYLWQWNNNGYFNQIPMESHLKSIGNPVEILMKSQRKFQWNTYQWTSIEHPVWISMKYQWKFIWNQIEIHLKYQWKFQWNNNWNAFKIQFEYQCKSIKNLVKILFLIKNWIFNWEFNWYFN